MIHMAAFSLNARSLNPLADHLSCSGKKSCCMRLYSTAVAVIKIHIIIPIPYLEWITGLALSFWLCD